MYACCSELFTDSGIGVALSVAFCQVEAADTAASIVPDGRVSPTISPVSVLYTG